MIIFCLENQKLYLLYILINVYSLWIIFIEFICSLNRYLQIFKTVIPYSKRIFYYKFRNVSSNWNFLKNITVENTAYKNIGLLGKYLMYLQDLWSPLLISWTSVTSDIHYIFLFRLVINNNLLFFVAIYFINQI